MEYIRNIIFVFAAAVLVSCSVVDLDPNDKYDTSYGFKDQTNVELYLNSFYKIIADYGQFGSNALGGNNSSMSDGLTDILKYGAMVAGAGDCNLIMTVDGQQSVNSNYFDAWTTCYGWVRRINEFLDGLDEYGSAFSEEQKNRFKAEALFYRAYAYFLIMRSHASVKDDLGMIIYDDIDEMTSAKKNRKRATVAESWEQVWKDISFAAGNLPVPGDARGRVNCYAAYALMARAMLYAGRYSDAEMAVNKIMTSQLYGYIDNYSDIFKTLDNKEVIWGFGYCLGELTHSFDQKYSQAGDVCANNGYGSGYAGPTQEFVDMYDYKDGRPFDISDEENRFVTNANASERDPRLAESVLWNRALWKGRALECYDGGVDQKYMPYGVTNNPGNSVTGYYMRKLLDETNLDFWVNGSYQPWIEFRYAEMMLIYAECLAHDNDFSGAFDVVSELRRHRFGRDDVYTMPMTDLETSLDVILKERCVELCFEGHRFWDLRRTGRAADVLDGKIYHGVMWTKTGDEIFSPTLISCEMGARKYPERFDRFPIPQTEISNNTEADQNSGW